MLPEIRNSSLDSVTALQAKKRRTRKRRHNLANLDRNSRNAKRKRRIREDFPSSNQRLSEEEQLSILPESIGSERKSQAQQSSNNSKNQNHDHLYYLSSPVSQSTLCSATSHCNETETSPNSSLPINTTTLSTVDDDRIVLTLSHDHIYVTPNTTTHDILTASSTSHSDRPQDAPNPPPPINTTLSTVDDNRIYLAPSAESHGIISSATTHCHSAVASPNFVVLRVVLPPFVDLRTLALPTSSSQSTPFTTVRFQPQATVPDEIPSPQVPVRNERTQTETVTQARRRPRTARRAFTYDRAASFNDADIGRMTATCPKCHARKWSSETPCMCCNLGKVSLPPSLPPPPPLHHLLTSTDSDALLFQDKIRKYNACFQMTSFGANRRIIEPGFMPTFKIQGQVYHRIGSLAADDDQQAAFLQIYFIDDYVQQAHQRIRNQRSGEAELNFQTVLHIQQMLADCNPYISVFKTAREQNIP